MPARLLVVDDDVDCCRAMQVTLERLGYAVTSTTSPLAALAKIAAGGFDVVVADLGMPEMDGLDLCQRILGMRPDMPVVVVTGQTTMSRAIGALRVGAYDFITKPVDNALFAQGVARAAQKRFLKQEVRRLSVRLDEKDYEEGSAAHLDKIDQMHKAEIAYHCTRHVDEEVEQGVRKRTAARADAQLADANLATMQSEERFRLLVNGVKDYAIYLLDPSGNVTSWNVGAERIKGYTAEEIIGRNASVFYRSVDAEDGHPQRNLAAAAQMGRAESEGWYVRKDGSTFWGNMVLSPIHDAAGVLLGFATITRDLTERRRLEEQFQQSQKMEALGSLAGGVAHDFNNLLSVILSYTSMLVDDSKLADPIRADLEEIHTAGMRATDLTRQLLAFGRQQILQPHPSNLNDILAGTEKMLHRLVREDVELTLLPAPRLGTAKVDPGQVEQIVVNLVVNARDAMPLGGKLTIETANVELDQEYAAQHVRVTAGPYVLLAVSDTGTGMDKATQARMFEPFFTTKEKGKGTGLGLATVFGIVRQSGGTICVYSEPGKGTTFKVYFPRTDEVVAHGANTSTLPPSVRRGTETILLVEDEEQVRVLVRTILRRHGYHVLEAQNGGEALLICEQHGAIIHLLLTDVVMPRMSGGQLADRLRTIRREMKVLFMSGYADNSIVHNGVLDSGLAFMPKPITPEALRRKVREVLDQ